MTTTPLYDETRDGPTWAPPLDVALELAREALAEHGQANIHDTAELIDAAVSLDSRLRHLVAALDAESRRTGGDAR